MACKVHTRRLSVLGVSIEEKKVFITTETWPRSLPSSPTWSGTAGSAKQSEDPPSHHSAAPGEDRHRTSTSPEPG
jgi:hypothetical protein